MITIQLLPFRDRKEPFPLVLMIYSTHLLCLAGGDAVSGRSCTCRTTMSLCCAAGTLSFTSRLNWNVSFQSCIHLRDWKSKSEAIQVFESSSDERNLRTSYSLPTRRICPDLQKRIILPFLCTFPVCCLKCMGSLSITVLSEASLWREQAELWWIIHLHSQTFRKMNYVFSFLSIFSALMTENSSLCHSMASSAVNMYRQES